MQIENESTMEPSESRAANLKRAMKNNGWLFITTVTYLVTLYLVRENQGWDPKLRVGVTLLPLLPGLVYLRILWGTFKSMDELECRIQLEAWAFALGGTVIVSTFLNVLNANSLGFENYPHGLELGGAYLSVFLFWCIGVAQATARYR